MKILTRILIHNWPLKMLSVGLAVVIWVYVLMTANPWTVRQIEVPVTIRRLPEGLQMMSITPPAVRVRIAGRQRRVERVTTDEMTAMAWLKDPGVGESEAPVTVSVGSQLRGVRVIGTGPATVVVSLDRTIQQPRAVQVSIRGLPAPGFEAVGQSCQPNEVTVSGPQTIVRSVARAVAVVDISGIDSTRALVSPIEARDARDMPVTGVKVHPATADVRVRVARVNTKTVPIVLGELTVASGLRIESIDVSPQVITVTGDPAVLAPLRSVRTEPVAFGPDETAVRVQVQLPRGVTAVTDDSVRVTVRFAPPAGSETRPSRAGAPKEGAPPAPSAPTPREKAPAAPSPAPPQGTPKAAAEHPRAAPPP